MGFRANDNGDNKNGGTESCDDDDDDNVSLRFINGVQSICTQKATVI